MIRRLKHILQRSLTFVASIYENIYIYILQKVYLLIKVKNMLAALKSILFIITSGAEKLYIIACVLYFFFLQNIIVFVVKRQKKWLMFSKFALVSELQPLQDHIYPLNKTIGLLN